MYTPLRKYVIVALFALATLRKCENSFWLSSPAPSQENTTNCGGFSPALSRSGRGRCGCAPVYAVDPSPIRRTTLWGAGAPFCGADAPCWELVPVAQPATDAAQAAAA